MSFRYQNQSSLILASLLSLPYSLLLTIPSEAVPGLRANHSVHPTTRIQSSSPSTSLPIVAPSAKIRIETAYKQLPLGFEANQGQADQQVDFIARGQGYALFITPEETIVRLQSPQHSPSNLESDEDLTPSASPTVQSTLRLQWIGANPQATPKGLGLRDSKTHYLLGHNPQNWRTQVSHHDKVQYQQVYPGIDLVYYGNQQQLQHDWIVSPGADPTVIRLQVQGAERLMLDDKGNLELHLKDGKVVQQKPILYQVVNGKRQIIAGGYKRLNNHQVGFTIGTYDRSLPLVIDPVLVYSGYLGSLGVDSGRSIAVDSSGNAYITGSTLSSSFPVQSPYQPAAGGWFDAFLVKLNPQGGLVYSTYLGGDGADIGLGVALDSSNNIYITGATRSNNFPVLNALQASRQGRSDAFLTKLNSLGSGLFYSTYLGGSSSDYGTGIAVDSAGNPYISGTTESTNFPVLNAPQGNLGGLADAFVSKFNVQGNGLIYSTYLGGASNDYGRAVAVDNGGNAYTTGSTSSTNFPVQNPRQASSNGLSEAFVTKLSAQGGLAYSTYLGGSDNDYGRGIAVDTLGSAYITGYSSSDNFPLQNPRQAVRGGLVDAFVSKLNGQGNGLTYSTYLGGADNDYGRSIAVDFFGNAYVAGYTLSGNFPVQNAPQPTWGGAWDAFATKFNTSGTTIVYSTYLGGTGNDYATGLAVVTRSGNVYVTGYTSSTNFPLQTPLQGALSGTQDAFVTQLSAN
jgi:hypothetical protein